MKRNDFNSEGAYEIFQAYMLHVSKILSSLPEDERDDIQNEITSHIYEAFFDSNIENEEKRIGEVLMNLGAPASYLKPMIAEKHLQRAAEKYNIWSIIKGIWLVLLAGSRYTLLSILYLFTLAGGLVILAKIFFPNKTGLFLNEGEVATIGFSSKIDPNMTELLGYWIIPLMIIAVVSFYFVITFLLNIILKAKNKTKCS